MTATTRRIVRADEAGRFGDVLSGELRKAFIGSTWYLMLLIGLGISALTVFGAAAETSEAAPGAVPAATATATTVRFWFMTLLGSGLFGVVFVSREFTTGSIARSVLLAGTRTRLFWAKSMVALAMGVLYAAVVIGVLFATLPVVGAVAGEDPVWSEEATRTVVGIAAVIVVSAPWGVVFGWLLRSSVVAVGVFLAVTLVVDEGLFRLAPALGRYTMQISMGAVFQDGKTEALEPVWGAVVMLAWLVVGSVAALVVLRRKDVL